MIKINDITIGSNNPFVLLAGPCVIESYDIAFKTAETVKNITEKYNIPFVFKSSFKKANRTSVDSFTGLGKQEGLKILEQIKTELELPVVTDIHKEEDVEMAAQIVDILQIPAFLCRQTDLLVAAGKTGKVVNVKKGQFLAPGDMIHAAQKIESTGNKNVMLCERGTTFGYGNLVVDMRGLLIMKELGYPVVMDATHAVQMPGNTSTTGGNPKFILPLAKAAAAVGIASLFLEVHPNPANAKSDAASQLPLERLESVLSVVKKIDDIVKSE